MFTLKHTTTQCNEKLLDVSTQLYKRYCPLVDGSVCRFVGYMHFFLKITWMTLNLPGRTSTSLFFNTQAIADNGRLKKGWPLKNPQTMSKISKVIWHSSNFSTIRNFSTGAQKLVKSFWNHRQLQIHFFLFIRDFFIRDMKLRFAKILRTK